MYFDSYHKINNSPQEGKPISDFQLHLLDNDFGGAHEVFGINDPKEINQLTIHLTKEELIKLRDFINLMVEKEKMYKKSEIIEAEV